MTNKWIEHVRAYAKEHNIPYGCAISKAKETYVKKVKLSKIEESRKYYPDNLKAILKKLNQNDTEQGKQMIRQIISNKGYPEDFKKYFKENEPNKYKLIYNKDEEESTKEKSKKKPPKEIKQEYIDKDLNDQFKRNMKTQFESDEFKNLTLEQQKRRFESLPPKFQEYIKENNKVLYNLIK
jgi:hypothetical protein